MPLRITDDTGRSWLATDFQQPKTGDWFVSDSGNNVLRQTSTNYPARSPQLILAPSVTGEYLSVEVGDTVKDGDEYRDFTGKWLPARYTIGDTVTSRDHIRRPVTPKKWKVGDRVRPRSKSEGCRISWLPSMVPFLGKSGIVIVSNENDVLVEFEPIAGQHNKWYFYQTDCDAAPVVTPAPKPLEVGEYARVLPKTVIADRSNWAKSMDAYVGKVGKVDEVRVIGSTTVCSLRFVDNAWWYYPDCLERITEAEYMAATAPKYRPFANADEFKPFREKWVRPNPDFVKNNFPANEHAEFLKVGGAIRVSEYGNAIVCFNDATSLSWDGAFKAVVFEDGTPFGVKVS